MACNDHHSKWWNLDRAATRWALFLPLALLALSSKGCSSLVDSRVPELIQQRVDPKMGRPYLLYRPSGYDNKRSWPLIVVCHSSFPDSPNRQIRGWTELAESKGFLVVAPTLKSVSRRIGRRSAERSTRIQNDEAHILAVVQHVRAGYNVSDDRILIAGHAEGGLVALYVGLRQPNVFRAISVAQPTFDSQFLAPAANWIDSHQPIRVYYNAESALWGDQPADCVEWLKQHGTDVRADPLGSARKTGTALAVQFFERIIREEPWIRIESARAPDYGVLARQFTLHATPAAQSVRWAFGDGDESPVNSPRHVYKKPGLYSVTTTLQIKNNILKRTLDVTVP